MKKFLALVMVCVALVSAASAQNKEHKFGYINTLELLSLMPEIKPADEELSKYAGELDALFTKMLQEYQAKITELEKTFASMSDDMKQIKAQELQDLEKRITNFEDGISDKLGKKKETLYSPILDKADVAIREVAKENGFTYIFDASVGAIIYADESDDILPLVKAKLGLK
jgi:outer membrane protein